MGWGYNLLENSYIKVNPQNTLAFWMAMVSEAYLFVL